MRTTALLVALVALPLQAANVAVPPALEPWVPWVLHGNEEQRCPLVDVDVHRCAWPGPLQLTVGAKGGSFEQRWSLMKEEHIMLPGGDERWPQDVVVDGKKAVVTDSGGLPAVRLGVGDHVVRGSFFWDEQPESLVIPQETALFTLVVKGRAVLFPRREGADVYFDREQEDGAQEREEDSQEVAVFRKVVDDAPLLIETRLVIDVAGKAREITVPWALLPGFEAASVSGPMPVRVEGTSLRAQVRPGSHTVVVVGRSVVKDTALVAPAAFDDGPPEEIWVYEARPSLRVAHVEGPPSIAADQTRLPGEWRHLPAYRLLPGESWKLVEDRRGDSDPPPSQLNLHRTVWIDFDGAGATVRDALSGSFNGDRLEMGEGTALGHVSVGGRDSFITALKGGAPGVEVRQKNLRVMAESRLTSVSSMPAVSWAHDFQAASIELELPPGFSLLHAGGVDNVSDTWLKRWTLFEIFLVVVLVAAILRLWGPLFAGIAAAGFVLSFQEEGAPIASWVTVVILAGLHRALPESVQRPMNRHWAVKLLAITRVFVAVVVALITLGFAVQQVRVGMYPTLDQSWRRVGDGGPANNMGMNNGDDGFFASPKGAANNDPGAPPEPEPEQVQQQQDFEQNAPQAQRPMARRERALVQKADVGALAGLRGSGSGGGGTGLESLFGSSSGIESVGVGYASTPTSGKKARMKKQMTVVDPDAIVQTGPGLPRWGWNAVTLSFSGPVQQGQRIDLWLLTPTMNLLLAFLRVALLAVLVLCALGFPGSAWPRAVLDRFRGRGAVWIGALVLATSSLWSSPAAAQVPDADTLDELRERLLAPPTCADSCVQIAALRVEASSSSLRLIFEVHAETSFSVPLPADDGQWTPRSILVDGKSANAVREDDRVLVRVEEGVHDVVVEGPLPQRDSVQLNLPMTPRRGTFSSSVWTLDGIHEDGVVDENLQLSRILKEEKSEAPDLKASGELPASVLPPFLRVERVVMLGLTFEVETRVVRLSPMGNPIVVDVPLLAGENVTTDGVRAETKDGKGVAKVSLGPNDAETSWHSTLSQAEALTLLAPTSVPWLESWQVQESPLWHVTRTGIPPVHGGVVDGSASFRPWPGEKIELSLLKPSGVAGSTVTIDEVKLLVNPGLRSTDATLTIELRASRGGQHPVKLPAGASLLSATINGALTPLRPVADVVTVPLNPGSQRVELVVRLPSGVAFKTTSPAFDVGKEAVNVEVTLDLPDDRWVLFCWGPRTGPAVLFWSFLVIVVVTALALSRVPVSTLKAHQWVLLSLGLTQVPVVVAALVAGWLLVLGWRAKPLFTERGRVHDAVFDLFQLTLVGWTVVAVVGFGYSIHEGLLGNPDMQIEGNGSSGTALRWYADRATSTVPLVTAWSVPMMAYRLAMLAWALWSAQALIRWLREGFKAFGAGGFYREPWKSAPKKPFAPMPSVNVPEAPAGAPTSAAAMSSAPVLIEKTPAPTPPPEGPAEPKTG
ncbi:MAG: hypothetical protein Q8O67_33370 [Deltaproteobacteria bacterium]|nr:hypothetical protein [Deltaproteobacteria bacterium]